MEPPRATDKTYLLCSQPCLPASFPTFLILWRLAEQAPLLFEGQRVQPTDTPEMVPPALSEMNSNSDYRSPGPLSSFPGPDLSLESRCTPALSDLLPLCNLAQTAENICPRPPRRTNSTTSPPKSVNRDTEDTRDRRFRPTESAATCTHIINQIRAIRVIESTSHLDTIYSAPIGMVHLFFVPSIQGCRD
jgi:hypothetical protein